MTEWQKDVVPAARAAASAIAAQFGSSVLGVLFYGSCLRTGEVEDKILDFYVIVDSYNTAYSSTWMAMANKILPPNVFYHEMEVEGITVRSKYAVLSFEDFIFRVSQTCLNVSVWARFCQPCMLLGVKNRAVERQMADHVSTAITTMLTNIVALKPEIRTSREIWIAAFEKTYASELRAEQDDKGLEIYLLDQGRYDQLAPLVLTDLSVKNGGSSVAQFKWFLRKWNGKIVSFLRLLKASATFDGGIDYLAWKIKRHSGVEIEIKHWMRKHPIIAGTVLFWKLRKKGAFK